MQVPRGLASSIYTQITDVELECDGFFNYDRTPKLSDAQSLAVFEANQKLIRAGSAPMLSAPPNAANVQQDLPSPHQMLSALPYAANGAVKAREAMEEATQKTEAADAAEAAEAAEAVDAAEAIHTSPSPPPSYDSWKLVMLTEAAAARGAVCLDGSTAGYYVERGAARGILLHIQGGGWCTSLADCRSRADTSLGSSANFAQDRDGILDGCG